MYDVYVFQYKTHPFKRSILSCNTEVHLNRFLAHRVERCTGEHRIITSEYAIFKCCKCKRIFYDAGDVFIRPNGHSISVLSLTHGSFKANVIDWKYSICFENNVYSCRLDIIFPVRKYSAYGMDLMYLLTDLVCRIGMSLRSAHEATMETGYLSVKVINLYVFMRL